MSEPAPLTYSVDEAAKAAGCGRDQIYTAIHAGDLAHVRFGRRIRVPIDALTDWLARLTTTAL